MGPKTNCLSTSPGACLSGVTFLVGMLSQAVIGTRSSYDCVHKIFFLASHALFAPRRPCVPYLAQNMPSLHTEYNIFSSSKTQQKKSHVSVCVMFDSRRWAIFFFFSCFFFFPTALGYLYNKFIYVCACFSSKLLRSDDRDSLKCGLYSFFFFFAYTYF